MESYDGSHFVMELIHATDRVTRTYRGRRGKFLHIRDILALRRAKGPILTPAEAAKSGGHECS
jgi:hypothetical protein